MTVSFFIQILLNIFMEMGDDISIKTSFKRDIAHVFDAVSSYLVKKRAQIKKRTIRIYIGYDTSTGSMGHFSIVQTAIEDLELFAKGWNIEILSVKIIRESKIDWTHPRYLVDWLLGSDIHIILCQGIHCGMWGIWKPVDCIREIRRLEYHPGFPAGINLRCPVFNGDKYTYINAAKGCTIPSLKIPLSLDMDGGAIGVVLESVNRFMKSTTQFGKGWILKAPYVQNSQGFSLRQVKDLSSFQNQYLQLTKNGGKSTSFPKANVPCAAVFDYLILQPKFNKAESKIILYNGKAQYIVSTSGKGLLGKFTHRELFEAAEKAWNHLKSSTNGAFLHDGLCRVDLFSDSDLNLVVNEYENLDATYTKLGGNSELNTRQFLRSYYVNKIGNLISSIN